MGTEFHATATVNANEGFTGRVQVDGVDRASLGTSPTTNAQLLFDHHATPTALSEGTRRASEGARCRIASQARLGLKAGGKTACRVDSYSRLIPGKLLVHQPGAGQGTGMTTDTPLHAGSAQNFHTCLFKNTDRFTNGSIIEIAYLYCSDKSPSPSRPLKV